LPLESFFARNKILFAGPLLLDLVAHVNYSNFLIFQFARSDNDKKTANNLQSFATCDLHKKTVNYLYPK